MIFPFVPDGDGFKYEAESEADKKVALELSRAQIFGASGAAFTPDGSRVAVGSRDMIWVADTNTFESIAKLGYIKASRFGGKKSLQFIDNERLAIGADGAILLWDLKEGLIKDRIRLISKSQSPRVIAWSGASKMLAFSIGSAMESVKVVHVGEDRFGAVRDLPGFEGVPSDLVFSRDGQYLAATGDGQGVFVRNVETGAQVGELPTEGFADNLELFHEDKLLVSGANVALWTFLQDQEALEFENANLQGQVTGQVVARVAGTIALGALTVFSIILAPLAIFEPSPSDELAYATYKVASAPVESSQQPWCGRSTTASSDGKWLVDIYPGITNEVIRIFNLESGQMVKSLNPRGEYSCTAKFSPNSKQLLITTDKVARIYDIHSWQYQDLSLH
jgi:WD40 repeat protein